MARKAKKIFHITGRVLDRKSEQGVANLRVEAWDKDAIIDDFVGSAVTREGGVFEIKFDQSHFRELFSDKQPDLYFKVFGDDKLIKSTEDSVLWNVKTPETEIVIEVNLPAEKPEPDGKPQPFKVAGLVRRVDGTPLVGALVRAFDKDLRSEECLTETTTDEAGRYEIIYTAAQFRRAEKASADLRISVCNEDGRELVSSAIIFNARPEETVDLTVGGEYRGPSEYEAMIAEITPVLQDVPLHELTEQDITFLAGDTGLEAQRLTWLAESARLAREAELPTEMFYGWFNQNLPTDPKAIWSRPENELMEALKTAIERNILPVQFNERLEVIAQEVRRRKVDEALLSAGESQPASLGDLLATMPSPLGIELQRAVAAATAELQVDDDQFTKRLEAAGLNAEQIAGTVRTLRLGELTQRHAPLVAELQEISGNGEHAPLRSLATLRREQWFDLAYTHGMPNGSGLTESAYAAQLEEKIEAQYPTAVFAARLNDGSLQITQPGFAAVGAFLNDHPTFDLIETNIPAFVKDADLDPEVDKKDLERSLLKIQRLKKMGANWQETGVLLETGLDSGLAVFKVGRDHLHEMVGERMASERIDNIFEHAKATHDITLALMVNYAPRFFTNRVAVFPPVQQIDNSVLKAYPTLQALFGDLNQCACRHCQSVLSPAAYFVDLLEFIEAGQSALSALLARRPDLVDLELSCENTKTELPHIDLVLEILENAVALPIKVTFPPGTDVNALLKASPLAKPIKELLEQTSLEVSDQTSVFREERELLGQEFATWIATDGARRWTLHQREEAFWMTFVYAGVSRRIILRFDIQGLPPSDVIGALDQNSVPAQLRSALEGLLAPSNNRDARLPLESYSIEKVADGTFWKVRFKRVVRITIIAVDPNVNPRGMLLLTNLSGQQLYSHQYHATYLRSVATELSGGVVHQLIRDLLPELPPGARYQLTPDGNDWIVSLAGELHINYTADSLTLKALTYQSSTPSQDLVASPENRNPSAYRRLQEASFPWSLPFDLPLEEVRAYLTRAGISRLRLMELVGPATRLGDDATAREVLGLSEAETKLITTSATPSRLWELWGLKVENNRAVIHDASIDEPVSDTPLNLLARISILLQQSRLSFVELQHVLQTQFVAAASQQTVSITPLTECRPSKMKLTDLTEGHLDRLHRFVRLWRRLGWRVHELDLAIAAVQPGANDFSETLRRLSHLKRLHEKLRLPVEVIACWWGGFGTPIYRDHTQTGLPEITPLYDRLFLNKTVQNPRDPDFQLNSDRTQLVSSATGKTISEKVEFVAAAFGIRRQDLAQFMSAPVQVADTLTLSNLSNLYRIIGLSQSLKLFITDYLGVLRLTGLDPFLSVEATIKFCEAVDFIRNSGFTIEELVYLLRHEVTTGLPIEITDVRATQIVADMRAALQAKRRETDIAYEAMSTDDPELKQLKQQLRLQVADVAVARVADLFGFDQAVASELLRNRLRHPNPADSGKRAIEVFVEKAFVESDLRKQPTNTDFPHAFALVRRLHKVAVLCSRHKIKLSELAWFAEAQSAPSAMSVLDFNALPVIPPAAGANNLFESWRQLIVLLQIRDRAQGSPSMLTNYLAALAQQQQNLDAARSVLVKGLSLPEKIVTDAAQQLGISVLNDYCNPTKLSQWFELLIALKTLGATVAQVTALAKSTLSLKEATIARNLLRAKYGTESWHELLTPVSDALRQKQRDALVDYLIAREGLRDANDLYEYYLIDPQMSCCMKTTRLLQAISAVQLFVQRCLLNLERGISPKVIDRKQWDWTKNYRVWEANRKVFLYPENWLSPELRDDKTQIFRELESELSQSEPSHEAARTALLTYLDQFNELAQIIVLGMYEDVQGEQQRTLYVVGRSPNQPYHYFWRKCERFGDEGMQWSGWERVDLDISGDHVIPFVFENDFHITWPVISRTGETKRWEVKLAWGRYTKRGWNQKKISRDSVFAEVLPGKDERASFAFRVQSTRVPMRIASSDVGTDGFTPQILTEEVRIRCYAAFDSSQKSEAITERGTKQVDTRGSLTLTVLVRALVKLGQSGPYDFARGAKVQLIVLEKEGESHNTWVTDAAIIIGSPREMLPTDVNGVSVFSVSASNTRESDRLLAARYRILVTYPADDPTKMRSQDAVLDPANPVCTWVPEFVFDAPASVVPVSPNNDPERSVDMQPLKDFVFTSHADLRLDATPGQNLEMIEDTLSYANGYLEKVARSNADPLKLGRAPDPLAQTVFTRTPERFFIARAASSDVSLSSNDIRGSLWHYRDDFGQYFLQVPRGATGPEWTVFVDGQPYVSVFRSVGAAELKDLFALRELQTLTDGGSRLTLHAPGRIPLPESIAEENVSFALRSPYGIYNWELFLHTPLLIADYLSKEQRFEDAQRWLHFIFDPTTNEPADPQNPAARFWRFLPFYQASRGESITQLFEWLANPNDNHPEEKTFRNQIETWKKNPFRPHAVARLRQSAYQWRVLFAYLDNLFAWGDQLFRRDTRESINEATLLYVLAAKILGPRPRLVGQQLQAPALSYRTFAERWDEFSNAWYAIADHPLVKAWLEVQEWLKKHGIVGPQANDEQTKSLTSLGMLYFCVPHNDQLLEYLNKVEDRLFKIRHCLNLEGIARELPLFEPPIDPELLVRATAAGVDIAAVLADRAEPLPHYRFNLMLPKAIELCTELKALGSALLSALEKKDAEQLTLLRSSQEIELLKLVAQIKQQQTEEARANVQTLSRTRGSVGDRYRYYQRLLGKSEIQVPTEGATAFEDPISPRLVPSANLHDTERRLGLIQSEQDQLARLTEAQIFSALEGVSSTAAGLAFAVKAVSQTPIDQNIAEAVGQLFNATASSFKALSSYASSWASRDALMAGYERRRDEWMHQSNLALKELAQIDKQLAAARLRLAIAQHEHSNHEQQIEHAERINEFMRQKYTNQELYSWMVGQISNVYFRSYQLAYDLAKRAERTFRFELGLEDSNFIQFGYWDSLKKGLLVGERLYHDLKRMEMAYMDQNKREYELTKHASLAMLDPIALLKLKETGECFVDLPEALFDLDYPGHYMRRLKSVSLTIPCVVGPYTGVNCKLALLKNSVRKNTNPKGNDGEYTSDEDGNDPRFVNNNGAIQSIATSSAQNDSGVFELNFRDERYLPFEGAGAISSWRIELAKDKDLRQFDYDTISDVIFHVRYTARDGGDALKTAAVTELREVLFAAAENGKPLVRLFSARHEFPNEWHKFLHPKDTDKEQTLQLGLTSERFPFQFQTKTIKISQMELFVKLQETLDYEDAQPLRFDLKRVGGTEFPAQEFKVPGSPITDLPHVKPFEKKDEVLGKWLIDVDREGGDANTETDTEMDTDSEVVACIPPWLRLKDNDDNYVVVEIGNKIYYQLNPDAIEDIVIVVQYSVTSQEKTTDVTNTQ